MITVNGDKTKLKKGITISNLLKECKFTWHSLIVKVNGEIVPEKEFKKYKVPAKADVRVIHMMTGG